MQNLLELIMNSLLAVQIRKNITESYKSKSQNWMEREYEDNVLDYWTLPSESYTVKFKKRRWFTR